MTRRLLLAIAAIFFIVSSFQSLQAQWLTRTDESSSWRTQRKPVVHETEGIGDAFKYWEQQRTFGLGYIPKNALQNAMQKRDAMAVAAHRGMSTLANEPQWSLVGPTNIGGRVNAIAINPKNANTIYIGAANGGVWKSMDAGASWTPLTDNLQSVSMGSLGIDPNDTNIVFAGTGETSNGVNSYSGYGLLRSSDGGNSWSDVGPSSVAAYSRVIVDPANSSIVYAAAARTGGGVLRSTDGGTTWNWLAGGLPQNASVTDMALAMNGSTPVIYAGVASHGIFQSMDGGDHWTELTPLAVLSLDSTSMTRIALDVDPANWQNVVVLDVNGNNTAGSDDLGGLVESNDGGQTWTDIGQQFESQGSPFQEGGGTPPQGWYDVYIKVDPADFSHMVFGGVGIATTFNGGGSWNVDYQSIHVDHHAAAFAPSDHNKLYVGCDGGVYFSADGGGSFSSNTFSIPITQFYGIGIDQTQDNVTYGGTQDNGTLSGANVSADNWGGILGGDGTFTLVDPKNPSIVYCANPGGDGQPYPSISTNGGYGVLSTNGINPKIDSLAWLNPFAADQNNVYWGCMRLLYSTNQGAKWNNCTKVFGQAYVQTTISTIDAFGDGKTVLVGTGGGNVYITNNVTASNGNATFTDVSAGLPGRWVTCVKFSPSSKTTFYATCSGFGAGHVFKTTDNGAHWTNISSSLPDIPVDALVMDPTNPTVLYIGTDVGVFFSPNDGTEWLPYGVGLPNTACVTMGIHTKDRTLRVGTHGRSIWQIPLQDNITGIVQPVQRTVWTVGDSAMIQWQGFTGAVSLQLSFDGGTTWQNLASGVSGTTYSIQNITYPTTDNALVKVSDGTNIVTSPLFSIAQQKAGNVIATVAELPFYLYDIAYDKDDNVLWATNFNAAEYHIFKIDPDKGTVLDSVLVQSSPQNSNRNGFTGIKYDPQSKHLFLQEVYGTADGDWNSYMYEVGTDGSVIRSQSSPDAYGTGILVRGSKILAVDRMVNQIPQAPNSSWNFSEYNALDLTATRNATYGPRGITFDPKLGEYLLAYTDFHGTSLNASYLLFLDTSTGMEQHALTIEEGGELTNVRGMEYDPRGDGNTVWMTILNSGNSAKIVKIALADGPASAVGPVITAVPSTINFGNLDTGKTKTASVELYNTGGADDVINSIAISPSGTPFSMTSVSNITLKAGDSMNVQILFSPHAPGPQGASLVIDSKLVAPTEFNITGDATENGARVLPSGNAPGWDLSISPNPASGDVELSLTAGNTGNASVEVFDATGRQVRTMPLGMLTMGDHEMELPTDGMPNGMYFVRVIGTQGQVAAARLAIER